MTWSKVDIRNARKIPLAPLLRQRGLRLRELAGDNHVVEDFHDLIVRDCYWIWKSRQLQGNTIDFFIIVQNLSFAQTMKLLLGTQKSPDEGGLAPTDQPATLEPLGESGTPPSQNRSKLPSYESDPPIPGP